MTATILDGTTASLAAADTYTTATAADTTGYNRLSGLVFADQPGLIEVLESVGGAFRTTYANYFPANQALPFSLDAVGTAAKLRITNTSDTDQTVLEAGLVGR